MNRTDCPCFYPRSPRPHARLGFAMITLAAVLCGCAKQPKAPIGPGPVPPGISKATYDAYRKGGWVPLLEPDSRFVPGTIFETKENTAPRWISSLETCGVPKEVLAPVSN